jgi:hypothetical protein
MAGFVTIRRYLDPIEAQMDRARLEAENIPARVVEPTAFNPLYTAAAGGVTLNVDPADAKRAEEVLNDVAVEDVHSYRVAAGDPSEDDDGDPDTVRCPRCEGEYCSFGRATPRGLSPGAAASGAALLLVPFLFLGKKRWRCEKCEHVWDDPKEGPKKPTRLEPSDPRPVFRLHRANGGLGVFAGLVVMFLLMMTAAALQITVIAFVAWAAPVIGWIVGGRIGADLCSEPRCRTVLPPSAETCPTCKGSIAGRVHSAAEHHAAAADFRRELLALHERQAAREKQRGEKKKARKRAGG